MRFLSFGHFNDCNFIRFDRLVNIHFKLQGLIASRLEMKLFQYVKTDIFETRPIPFLSFVGIRWQLYSNELIICDCFGVVGYDYERVS